MDKTMIETIVLFLGALWCLWKFFIDKNIRSLFIAFVLLIGILPEWPLFLPRKLSFSIVSLLAAIFLFYEQIYQKRFKPLSQMTYICVVLFVIFSLLFASDAFFASIAKRSPRHKTTQAAIPKKTQKSVFGFAGIPAFSSLSFAPIIQ